MQTVPHGGAGAGAGTSPEGSASVSGLKKLSGSGAGLAPSASLLGRLRAAAGTPALSRDASDPRLVDTPTLRSPTGTGRSLLGGAFAFAAGGGSSSSSGAGPGSSPPPTRLEKLGGEDALKVIVETFVEAVAEDARVGKFFGNVSKPLLSKKLRMMLEGMLGDKNSYAYSVQGMHRAHMHLKLDEGDFDAFIDVARRVLPKCGVPQAEADELVQDLARFRDPVLGKGVWDD